MLLTVAAMRITFLIPVLFTIGCGTDRDPNTTDPTDPTDPNPTDPTGTPTPQPGKDPTASSVPTPDAGTWGSGSDGSGGSGWGSGSGSGSDECEPDCSPPTCEEDMSTRHANLLAPGDFSCDAPKVLICHIPPGNPENAHTICVGEPAVEPHLTLHGDSIGACPEETCPEPTPWPAPDPGSNW